MKPLLTLHTPKKSQKYYENGLWTNATFYSLVAEHAMVKPNAWAIRDGSRRLNWRQLKEFIDSFSLKLENSGLEIGDRVSFWLSNRIEAVVIFIACSRNGYVCNPSLHKNYTVDEVFHLLSRIEAAGFIYEENYGANGCTENITKKTENSDTLKIVMELPKTNFGNNSMEIKHTQTAKKPHNDPDAVTYLAFTSGTTDTPKAVMHSANTLLANCRDMVRDWNHNEHTVVLSLSPLSHHIAWVALGQALTSGSELVINDPPNNVKPLDWIIETKANYVLGVPTHAIDIQADQKARGMSKIGDLKIFYLSGAAIPPAVAETFIRQGVTPQNVYGMSENSSHQYTHPDDNYFTIINTCGRGGKSYEISIFDIDNPDNKLEPGQVGQIGGRGACLMLGYFDNQRATETAFNRNGWFLSGDLGRIDDKGNLEVLGRLKDVIIRGGRNIYPKKIEDLATKHPAVDKAAAFPIKDARLGEKVCLAVLLTIGEKITPETLLAHLHESGLSKFDMPEYFALPLQFPMTASGKIIKRQLTLQANNGNFEVTSCRFTPSEKK